MLYIFSVEDIAKFNNSEGIF